MAVATSDSASHFATTPFALRAYAKGSGEYSLTIYISVTSHSLTLIIHPVVTTRVQMASKWRSLGCHGKRMEVATSDSASHFATTPFALRAYAKGSGEYSLTIKSESPTNQSTLIHYP
ncbi:hypothetical protein Tco_0511566 [Tanacetum coccineum]